MEKLKEENKNLINLRSSLITIMIVLTGGIVGLLLTQATNPLTIIFIILGIYFDSLFLLNVLSINNRLTKNIGDL